MTMRLVMGCLLLAGSVMAAGDVVIENARFKLVVGSDACAKSLVVKKTGVECLVAGEEVALFETTQNRPFNNEIKLAYPNKRTTYRANTLRREGDVLIVGFEIAPYEARVRVKEYADFVTLTLEDFIVEKGDYGSYFCMDLPPCVEFRVCQLPVRERKNFGVWLNTVWDDEGGVAVVGTSPWPRIDQQPRKGYRVLYADALSEVKLKGVGAAIVAAPGGEMLDCLDALERDLGLPRGVQSRRSEYINASIFWVSELLTDERVDFYIDACKKAGMRMMLIYYEALTGDKGYLTIDDYKPKAEVFPNGYADLRRRLDKIKAAGITPGIHVLQTHIGLQGHYVTPVADPRLNLVRRFTLAKPISVSEKPAEIFVLENPEAAMMHERRRVLKFGGELFSYTAYTTEPPYRFTGVTRGTFETRAAEHPAGEIGGTLDISEYGGTSCYIDQLTDLQDEIADKIAALYNCGFKFAYFDGSEGVNPPCEVYVPLAQWRVVKKFNEPPLFTEGAAKAHFGWHLQAGANAFDVFPPEIYKAMIDKFPLDEAPIMRRDFTRLDFGWWRIYQPGTKPRKVAGETVGTQPDMWEYGTSKAAAWDCPATIQMSVSAIKNLPRMADTFEVMRRWEDVRARHLMTDDWRARLRVPGKEYHLLLNGKDEYELADVEEIAAKPIRAFLFKRNGKTCVTFWHTRGSATIKLPLAAGAYTIRETPDGAPIPCGADASFTVSNRLYLETTCTPEVVKKAFAELAK